MAKLYHVSFNEVKDSMFYPRIPASRAPEEDKTIPRICFSDSIEKCISSMPNGGKALKNLFVRSKLLPINPILHVYSIEESHIPASNLIPTEKVAEYVQDANATRETWVVNRSVVCKHEIIEVTDVRIKHRLDAYGHETYEIKNMEWKLLDKLPTNAPETLLSKVIKKLEIADGFTLRTVLAEWD